MLDDGLRQQLARPTDTSTAGTELWIREKSQGKHSSGAGRRLQDNSKEKNPFSLTGTWIAKYDLATDMAKCYTVLYPGDRTCSRPTLLVWYLEPFLTFKNN